ncbi:MAG: hypothetical protein GTN99_06545, partial [Candidatus Dadabacteria bacterium]|nr:hypothetical protein [Candidatus Dadabacteria bacterium]
MRYFLLQFTVLFLFTAAYVYSIPDSAENIATAYGIGNFGKVNKISYTFNVHINGKNIQRKWIWHPKTHEVEYVNGNIKYKRTEITESLKDIDH